MATTPAPATPRKLGAETERSHARRLAEGFLDRYLSGDAVLDIGFRGGTADAVPVTDKAIGVELDYPGYDGTHLPFADGSQDAVFASHTLEHVADYQAVLADWFRVLGVGGYLVIAVPHRHLYERKAALPSRFNGDHKRFYTPGSLLAEIEESLPVAAWRLRSLRDIDAGFSYSVPPLQRPRGCYEIELVIQKIETPAYAASLVPSAASERLVRFFADLIADLAHARASGDDRSAHEAALLLQSLPLPPFIRLEPALPKHLARQDAMAVLKPLVERAPFDEADYLASYPDIRAAVAAGAVASGHAHYVAAGYFKGRIARPEPAIFG